VYLPFRDTARRPFFEGEAIAGRAIAGVTKESVRTRSIPGNSSEDR